MAQLRQVALHHERAGAARRQSRGPGTDLTMAGGGVMSPTPDKRGRDLVSVVGILADRFTQVQLGFRSGQNPQIPKWRHAAPPLFAYLFRRQFCTFCENLNLIGPEIF